MHPERPVLHHRTLRGFSLLEMIVVLAVLVGLAGTVLPLMASEIEDTRISRAMADASRVSGAVERYARDLGALPGALEKGGATTSLTSAAPLPGGLPTGPRARLAEWIGPEAAGRAETAKGWKGPYLGEVGPDPWGRAYVVLVPSGGTRGHVWALSAGRDGALQTHEFSDAIAGDDVGVMLR